MEKKKLAGILASSLMIGFSLGGSVIASAHSMKTSNGMNQSKSSMTHSTMKNSIDTSDVLVGAAASPPSGNGNGMVFFEQAHTSKMITVPVFKNANAFQLAVAGPIAYVPTLQGKTYLINLQTHRVISHFSSPIGARIASLSNDDHTLIITGGKSVTAYALPSLKRIWQISTGGNTLSVAGNIAYLSGNSASKTALIDLKSGKVTGTLPVGMIEDSVYDPQKHTLWLANWSNGDMTVVNTKTHRIANVIHQSEGGGFSMQDMGSMKNMMKATGGYMQLAVGPRGNHVYAASFSGNILVFNARNNTFEKNIPTVPMAKLSGIAIDPSGQYAYATVEDMKETVAISLKNDKLAATFPHLVSNRWIALH
ncbi:YncE family protein [Ferroacidibacillus organovorans]|uniref:Uncharacterized protein n=1 Tax=Ferroacidibacillus organovorans TaxID=1765683 RepID=A0A853KBM0_9BACL|nr:hypothetical protein [Ferroacidibacillus organovorans]KYP81096.1 hypothetical protein AYJ22_08810 [Ferroacidibacillus organovorans]OAG93798.1 hypothetical protein AYW79_08775 [Ferroacidibacillus organovorans]